jgi:hypothetical protein
MYSTSEHGSYPNLANQIEPLMKSQRNDAIFWGHDHIFESFWAFSNESYGGTYCFTASGGGGSLKSVMDVEELGDRVWNGTKNVYGNYINIVKGSSDNRFSSQRGYE